MSTDGTTIAIFGDAELSLWGLLLGGAEPQLAVGFLNADSADLRLESAHVDRDDDQVWTVTAGERSLRLERALATTRSADGGATLEPMRVTGTIKLGDAEHDLDIGGVVTQARLDGSTDSLRVIGSWFPAGHQVALQAARPRASKGHDRDQVDVIALGEREPVAFDPRLSTTYSGDGAPIDTGIEMWIGADEDGDQYPRRVSGVATGAAVQGDAGGLKVTAFALECLSRGELGAGVYVLVQAS
jgi:hypothetical protein